MLLGKVKTLNTHNLTKKRF